MPQMVKKCVKVPTHFKSVLFQISLLYSVKNVRIDHQNLGIGGELLTPKWEMSIISTIPLQDNPVAKVSYRPPILFEMGNFVLINIFTYISKEILDRKLLIWW